MPDEWSTLAKSHGRRSVMNLSITDAELDAETNRQIGILFPMIARELHGHERSALDFGCGSGRFSHALARTIHGRVTAFDPCRELIDLATGYLDVDYHSGSPEGFFHECNVNETTFDVVFAAQVLGSPELNLDATAAGLVGVLADDGLLIVTDHMPDPIPSRRWWKFRPVGAYRELFREYGVDLRVAGTMTQLENSVTVLVGRRT